MRTRVRYPVLVLAVIVAAVTGGCATDVMLRNPRTGETATCKASLAGFNPWSQQEACIGGHIAGGWVRAE
jgi:hypothetical protein